MAEVRMQQAQRPEQQTGFQRARAIRLQAVRDNQTVPTVKVFASSPEAHAVLRHPNGTKFRGTFGTATEWPHDNFTHRRIMDGSISIKAAKERPASSGKLGVREAAAAMRPDPKDVPPVQPLSAMKEQKPQEQRPAPQKPPV